jgi:hypothetical protein
MSREWKFYLTDVVACRKVPELLKSVGRFLAESGDG